MGCTEGHTTTKEYRPDPCVWTGAGAGPVCADQQRHGPPRVTHHVVPQRERVQPDQGRQYEIGLKAQFLEGRGEATLAAYYIVKKDLLTTDPTNPDNTIQIGQQSSYGVEVAIGLTPIPQLAINANMALLDAQFDDLLEVEGDALVSRDGNQPPDVPELLANVWVVYMLTPAWRLGGGMQYVGTG